MLRTGVIAKKLGMTRLFLEDGRQVPVTVLHVDNVQVIAQRTVETDGYVALQLGAGEAKAKRVTGAMRGHFAKANVAPKRKIAEFRVAAENLVEVGEEIIADHYFAGQYVDIAGTSIGKGYAGVMKRWNVAGASNTHGTEKTHRSGGSIGMHTFPGRVFKNMKMAGHLGAERVTKENLLVLEVRPDDNVILVKGPVPGARNSLVMVRKQ